MPGLSLSPSMMAMLGGGGGADVVAPTLSTLSPTDNATDVAVSANLVATFSENVQFGASVAIGLFLVDDTPVQSWTQADIGAGISISGAVLTINPTAFLTQGQEHYVTISAGSIEDLAGNDFSGLAEGAWSFASFSPATMFTGGKAGVFYDTATLSSLFSDRSATPVTPAAVDGPVGTRKDLSGNNNHQIAASDAARPTLRTAGGLYWLEGDMSDDRLIGGDISAVGASGAVFQGVSSDNVGAAVFLHRQPTSAGFWFGAAQSGSGSVAHDGAVSVTGFNVDGVAIANTRAALFTAVASASGATPHLFEARGATLGSVTTFATGFYDATFRRIRRDYGLVVISESDLGSNQTAVRQWFSSRMGI